MCSIILLLNVIFNWSHLFIMLLSERKMAALTLSPLYILITPNSYCGAIKGLRPIGILSIYHNISINVKIIN